MDNHSEIHNVKDERKDRLFKTRPLFQLLRKNCVMHIAEEHNSIDEQMVPSKGRNFLRRYMPNKPYKWGFKIFSRNGSLCQVYDFDLEQAPYPVNPKISRKLGYRGVDTVLKLYRHIPNNKGYKPYFDNDFTYTKLLLELQSKIIWAAGTLRSHRMRGCILKSEKDLEKYSRGSYDGAVKKNSMIRIVRWLDNRAVNLGSNFAYIEPLHKCKRHSKKERKDLEMRLLNTVKLYNSSMGGVDLFDILQNLYHLHCKSKSVPP